MKRIGIFGTSGMAREAGDIAYEMGYEPIYIAENQQELTAWSFDAEAILEKDIPKLKGTLFAIGIGDNHIRKKIALNFQKQLQFTNLIHPTATFGRLQRKAIETARGLIVCAGARLTNGINLGDFCIVNQNVAIAHDTQIEEFVHLAPGSIISGNVHIEPCAWIGAGAIINQGDNTEKLCIGSNTLIGSGAVVLRNCEPNATYAGVPAKRIK